MTQPPLSFWDCDVDQLLERLDTSQQGLSNAVARQRLTTLAAARLKPHRRTRLSILLAQFNSPIILLLFCSAVLSFLLDDRTMANTLKYRYVRHQRSLWLHVQNGRRENVASDQLTNTERTLPFRLKGRFLRSDSHGIANNWTVIDFRGIAGIPISGLMVVTIYLAR